MKKITEENINYLLKVLKERFENNMHRHELINWNDVENKLLNNKDKLVSLHEMEITGGEPDVVLYDDNLDQYVFYDCSKETPLSRRSLCYDNEALESRKSNRPVNSAMKMAEDMEVTILNEEEYLYLQKLEEFDLKTSSWLLTDKETRSLGGSIFGDRRYNRVFIYHNGSESYYSTRGFRASKKI